MNLYMTFIEISLLSLIKYKYNVNIFDINYIYLSKGVVKLVFFYFLFK